MSMNIPVVPISSIEVHKLALERLYHEDILLTQRTYNYLTFNIFLAAALAFAGISKTSLGVFGNLVVVVGVVVSILQSAFGRRIETAIDFWRVYLRLIEEKASIPADHLLFIFYNKGEVETPWGSICGRPVVFKTWPWSWMPSTNTMIGVLLPFIIETVWFLAAFIPLANAHIFWPSAAVGATWFCAFIITWFWPLPGKPKILETKQT